MSSHNIKERLAAAYRTDAGQILAYLASRCGDLSLAEDSLHDVCLQAQAQWAERGIPANPSAWLCKAAVRRMIDRLRHTTRRHAEVEKRFVADALASISSFESMQEIPDERLSLIFTCCHPALNNKAQIALTLNTLCGLTVKEIARAFLVSETTMSQRLVRAKKKLSVNGIRYQTPSGDGLRARLNSVLNVVYLIYNESYSAFEGPTLTRDDLASEAIRLAQLLVTVFPKPDPEAKGLLALLLLHQARRPAMIDEKGMRVSLEHQNRDLWSQEMIQEGKEQLLQAFSQGNIGSFQIQAAISGVHACASSWGSVDWAQIIGLYRELLKHQPSAITRLNLYVAVAYSGEYALAKLGIDALHDELNGYPPFHVAMSKVDAELGNLNTAEYHLRCAIKQTKNNQEQAFLKRRLKALLMRRVKSSR